MKNLLEFDENLNDLRIYFNDRHLIEFKKFIIDKNYDDAKKYAYELVERGYYDAETVQEKLYCYLPVSQPGDRVKSLFDCCDDEDIIWYDYDDEEYYNMILKHEEKRIKRNQDESTLILI